MTDHKKSEGQKNYKQPPLQRDRHITRDPERLGDEMMDRIMASQCGLYRVCVYRICRRAKRCFGPKVACLYHHSGLAHDRWDRIIARGDDD